MALKPFFRRYWWVVMLVFALVRLLEHYGLDPQGPLDGLRGRTASATTYILQRFDDIRPAVVASAFYDRLGDCRYDWRTVCLCSVRQEIVWQRRPPSHQQPFSSYPWSMSTPLEPGFPTTKQVFHPPGCHRDDTWAPFGWLSGFTKGLPGLAATAIVKVFGLRDAAMHSARLIVSQGALAWALGGLTALVAVLFVLGMLEEAGQAASRRPGELLKGIVGGLVALLLVPGIVALVAGALKWILWGTVFVLGYLLTGLIWGLIGIIGVITMLGRITAAPEGAKEIITAGRHLMRRMRRRKPVTTSPAPATARRS